jgi:hypothetical protein
MTRPLQPPLGSSHATHTHTRGGGASHAAPSGGPTAQRGALPGLYQVAQAPRGLSLRSPPPHQARDGTMTATPVTPRHGARQDVRVETEYLPIGSRLRVTAQRYCARCGWTVVAGALAELQWVAAHQDHRRIT